MKLRTNILVFLAACAAVLSCEKTQERTATPVAWTGSSASITVGAATKTSLDGLAPAWEASDVLSVFDADGTPVAFSNATGAGTSATFTTTAWTGKAPSYAAFTNGTPTCTVATGVLGVTIPAAQAAPAGSFASEASPSVGQVASAEGVYSISSMKNVAALLSFSFSGSDIASLTIEGGNGEQVAGSASVTYSTMAWTAGTSPATSVVLTPASGGAFASGVTYYAAILPGSYSKGLKFTITDTLDGTRVKEVGKDLGLNLLRNHVCAFNEVDAAVAPAEFVVAIDLTSGWPFDESVAASGSQTAAGESYTYSYSPALDLTFKLVKPSTGNYSYSSGKLSFDAAGGRLVLPAIPNRYLNSVVVVHEMDGAKAFEVHKVSDDSQIGVRHTTSVWKGPVPVAKFSPHESGRCYVSLLTAGTSLTHIYLRYTSTDDGTDAVKLGFESPYNTWNQSTNGDTYTNDGTTSCFFGIYARNAHTSDALDDYSFTQTVNGKDYTFTALKPTSGYSQGDLFCWANGLWSGALGDDRYLKLPRTGKLVWVRADVGNSTNGTNGKFIRIDAKDAGETEYSTVGAGVYLGATAYGTGDGSSKENNAEFWTWCLDDSYSATKDYYLYCGNGSTWMDELVLIYL